MTWLLTMAMTFVALAGCTAVGPGFRLPVDAVSAQGAFLGGSETAFLEDPLPDACWRLYDSPDLDRLIRQAFVANTDLRVAATHIARSIAASEHAEAAIRPTTTTQASAGYGRRSAEEELRLAAQTALAYFEVCSLGREIDVAQRAVEIQVRSTELARRLLQAGRGSPSDLTRSMAQEEQIRAGLPVLRGVRRIALYRLAVLTGQTPQAFERDVEACTQPPALMQSLPIGDGGALMRRRPDIRRAEFDVRSATARIGTATADLYPQIVLGASVGSAGLDRRFLSADTFKFSLGPLVSWQFPDRTRAPARIAAADADLQGAFAHFDGVVLTALKEIESALETYARSLERRALLELALRHAGRAAADAELLFSAGRHGYLPVLDATRTLIAAEQALAAADSKLASDQVGVFLALGGGWPAE